MEGVAGMMENIVACSVRAAGMHGEYAGEPVVVKQLFCFTKLGTGQEITVAAQVRLLRLRQTACTKAVCSAAGRCSSSLQ
jgi:hypothetical protein